MVCCLQLNSIACGHFKALQIDGRQILRFERQLPVAVFVIIGMRNVVVVVYHIFDKTDAAIQGSMLKVMLDKHGNLCQLLEAGS